MEDVDLGGGFTIRSLPPEELSKFVDLNDREVFGHGVDLFSNLLEEEKTKLAGLRKNIEKAYQLNLGVFYEETQIGWHFGVQKQPHSFYMTNSGILPNFRRKGIYSRLLDEVVEHLFSVGFLEVFSQHHLTNNPILIAKLKNNFIVTGIEMDPRFGMMLVLKRFKHQERVDVAHFRAGFLNNQDILNRLQDARDVQVSVD